jgi:hypothetical protein
LQDAYERVDGKSCAKSGLCVVRTVVGEVLAICASFDDQFHRSINGEAYDPVVRFRLTFDEQVYLVAVARAPCSDGGNGERKAKIATLSCPESRPISVNHAGGISCRVRNMSPAGACLEVTSHVGIPDNFVLAVSYEKFTRACHVIWRSHMSMGAEFLPV